jgi:dTDP-4-dehydrorhamnose reductase
MRVLILGANGMLGHALCRAYRGRFDTWATVRDAAWANADLGLRRPDRLLSDVDAQRLDTVDQALTIVRPDAVINCIGIIKQRPEVENPRLSIAVNALFPHQLAELCRSAGACLIQISTDCVFSGRKGGYTEDDIPDAEDLYGRTKYLGEVSGPRCLTLRTSIIGRELKSKLGLLEWFLGRRGGTATGYCRAIFSGLTAPALADVIGDVLERQPSLSGVWHVSSEPISKYELLQLVNQAFGLGVRLAEDWTFVCDRSLDSGRFRAATGFRPPSWPEMIDRLAHGPAS